MKKKQRLSQYVIVAWVVMPVLSLFMLVAATTAQAQQSDPAPTPDPTVQALANSVEQQAQEIEMLQKRLTLTNDTFDVKLQQANIPVIIFGIVGIAGIAGAIVSIWHHWEKMHELDEKFSQRMVELDKKFSQQMIELEGEFEAKEAKLWEQFSHKMQKQFEEELYGLDATMLTIRIREGEYKENIERRLNLSGFKNVSGYSDLDKRLIRGVTVVPVTGDEQVDEFNKFLKLYEKELNPEKAAFVIYTHGERIQGIAADAFENLSFANTPTTLTTNILAVGRGLKR
jgi:hypothetical protein